MARARNIKPAIFKNEVLGVADPLYTLLFEGLWVLADRAGRLEDRPLRIKAETFPYRDGLDVSAMLDWLQSNAFIKRYEVSGIKYIAILNFTKHQTPHPNEAQSVIPAPEESVRTLTNGESRSTKGNSARSDSLLSDSLQSDTPSLRSGVRARKAKTPLPEDFGISDRVRAWALANGHDKLDQHLANFRLACRAKDYAYVDWDAAFMKAIAADWARVRGPPKSRHDKAAEWVGQITGKANERTIDGVAERVD